MAKSILQGNLKECYITGSTRDLHQHHIYRGVNRKVSDKHGFWVWLRFDWHNGADYGVHGIHGGVLDMRLKRLCQIEFEKTHSREEFMALIGRNYLDEEN